MRLVQIGTRFINMDAVTIADVSEEQVDLYFGDGDPREPDASLQQAEAQALKRWLEQNAEDVMRANRALSAPNARRQRRV